MLKVEGAKKHYTHRGKVIAALDDMHLEIASRDFVAIVGPSGSGKSTLLLALGGMLSLTEGKICLDGESLYDLSPDKRAKVRGEKIGFVFQTFNLIPYLTALENVQVPMMLNGAAEEKQKDKAATLLKRVGLADRLDHKPSELSVGQQQRVALARVLANDPKLILADEPTGNLDPETREQIMRFLVELNEEGRTVVMVTHDPEVARRAKKTLTLNQGRILNGHEPGLAQKISSKSPLAQKES
jgi:putative ABC transport system ATP-binding protein